MPLHLDALVDVAAIDMVSTKKMLACHALRCQLMCISTPAPTDLPPGFGARGSKARVSHKPQVGITRRM